MLLDIWLVVQCGRLLRMERRTLFMLWTIIIRKRGVFWWWKWLSKSSWEKWLACTWCSFCTWVIHVGKVKPVYKGPVYSGDPVYCSHWTISWKFCLTFSVTFTHIWQSPVTPRQKERQNTCNRKSMTDQKHFNNFKFRWNFMQVHDHLLSLLLIHFYPCFLKAPEWSCSGNP